MDHIAEILLSDEGNLLYKATGWALRTTSQMDRPKLAYFLDQHLDQHRERG